METLKRVAKEVNLILENKRKELSLSFIEDTHTYYMKDIDGIVKSNFPSVSSVVKKFYNPFDEYSKSLQMCNGDVDKQAILLAEWKGKGDYATNMGSRVHFELEKELIKRYDNYKVVRQPIFVCDENQISKGNRMIKAGNDYLDLMHERGAILLDTEIVLGSNRLGYVGQPDKVWLMWNRDKTQIGIVITDWKTNQPKNFEVMPYTGFLYPPFSDYNDTALQHYFIQLPLYGRLILDMLIGSKYENIPVFGCVVVLLLDTMQYQEYKVPEIFNKKLLTMDLNNYIIKK